MYRNLFAVVAALALGAGAAAAATPTATQSGQSLEQRVLAAQKAIGTVTNPTQDPAVKASQEKVAQYYWHNWNNYFHNWHNY